MGEKSHDDDEWGWDGDSDATNGPRVNIPEVPKGAVIGIAVGIAATGIAMGIKRLYHKSHEGNENVSTD